MTDSKNKILDKIRRSRACVDRKDIAELDQLYNQFKDVTTQPRNLVSNDLVGDFIHNASKVNTEIDIIDGVEDIPARLTQVFNQRNIPRKLVCSTDEILSAIDWQQGLPEFEIYRGKAMPHFSSSLSVAYAGVAETGTLVLLSSRENPTTLNFLPEFHFVVLKRSNIVAFFEDCWNTLQSKSKDADQLLPRNINMISGPSKTADVEQTIQQGAHGPRYLHVFLCSN